MQTQYAYATDADFGSTGFWDADSDNNAGDSTRPVRNANPLTAHSLTAEDARSEYVRLRRKAKRVAAPRHRRRED